MTGIFFLTFTAGGGYNSGKERFINIIIKIKFMKMDKPPYEPNADEKDLAEQMLTPTEEEFSLERAASQTKLENAGLKGHLKMSESDSYLSFAKNKIVVLDGEIDGNKIRVGHQYDGKFWAQINDFSLSEEKAKKLFETLRPYAQDISEEEKMEKRRQKEIMEGIPPQDEVFEEILKKASRKE